MQLYQLSIIQLDNVSNTHVSVKLADGDEKFLPIFHKNEKLFSNTLFPSSVCTKNVF